MTNNLCAAMKLYTGSKIKWKGGEVLVPCHSTIAIQRTTFRFYFVYFFSWQFVLLFFPVLLLSSQPLLVCGSDFHRGSQVFCDHSQAFLVCTTNPSWGKAWQFRDQPIRIKRTKSNGISLPRVSAGGAGLNQKGLHVKCPETVIWVKQVKCITFILIFSSYFVVSGLFSNPHIVRQHNWEKTTMHQQLPKGASTQ